MSPRLLGPNTKLLHLLVADLWLRRQFLEPQQVAHSSCLGGLRIIFSFSPIWQDL